MKALGKLASVDAVAFNWCLDHCHYPLLQRLSRYISKLGDGGFYLLVGLLVAQLEPVLGPDFLKAGLLAFAVELPLYLVLKNTIRRDRPCDRFSHFSAAIVPADTFSFPSGHAAAAFVFATVLSAYYPAWWGLCYAVAMLIGCARVMLGVHYPCDIVAGALLGISSAQLVLNLMEQF